MVEKKGLEDITNYLFLEYRVSKKNDTSMVLMKVEDRQKPDPDKLKIVAGSEDKRLCCRCGAIYRVDKAGLQEEKESCVYHWGRCFRARSSRERYNSTGIHSTWTCCQSKADEDGCSVATNHVTDTMDWANMKGFVTTIDKGEEVGKMFALDCEMCNTTVGNELTRVTVVDFTGATCYESLVMPENPIVDYNTRFSGITAEDMEGVDWSVNFIRDLVREEETSHGVNSDRVVVGGFSQVKYN